MTKQRFLDEAAWKQALSEGNSDAIRQTYESCYAPIAAMVRNNNGSSDDAQDLFQDTLVAIIEKIQKGNLAIRSEC